MDPSWLWHRSTGVKRWFIVTAIVINPTTDDWIKHPGKVLKALITAQLYAPPPHLLTHFLCRLVTHSRAEVNEVLSPTILRPPGSKRKAQKVKSLVWVTASPVIILTVDDLRPFCMKLQLALWQPFLYDRLEPPGLLLTLAMRPCGWAPRYLLLWSNRAIDGRGLSPH